LRESLFKYLLLKNPSVEGKRREGVQNAIGLKSQEHDKIEERRTKGINK
jgi:hypothetical protein